VFPQTYYIWSVERVAMLFHSRRWGERLVPLGPAYLEGPPEGGQALEPGLEPGVDRRDRHLLRPPVLNRVNLSPDLTDKLTEFGVATAGADGGTPPKKD
jgi:hypothetical protein